MESERTKDELRAAAWKLAAIEGRARAAAVLKQIAQEIDNASWEGPGNR